MKAKLFSVYFQIAVSSMIATSDSRANGTIPEPREYRTTVTRRTSGERVSAIIKGLMNENLVVMTLKIGSQDTGQRAAGWINIDAKPSVCWRDLPKSYTSRTGCPVAGFGSYNRFAQVQLLTSLLGWEYQGIGTRLMEAAIKESVLQGFEGRVALKPEHIIPSNLTYRKEGESPMPFYYCKIGMRAKSQEDNRTIEKAIKELQKGKKPTFINSILFFPDETINDWLKKIETDLPRFP